MVKTTGPAADQPPQGVRHPAHQDAHPGAAARSCALGERAGRFARGQPHTRPGEPDPAVRGRTGAGFPAGRFVRLQGRPRESRRCPVSPGGRRARVPGQHPSRLGRRAGQGSASQSAPPARPRHRSGGIFRPRRRIPPGAAAAWADTATPGATVVAAKGHLDRARRLGLHESSSPTKFADQHQDVLKAVLAGDIDLAKSTMRQHLRAVFDDIARIQARSPELFATSDSTPVRRSVAVWQ